MMRKWVLTAASALCGLAATPVEAMPFSALADSRPEATLIAQGCGPGWFRNPWGRCVPMGGPPAPYYRPYPYARPYPYGPRPYPYGPHCWWRGGMRVCR